MIRAENARIDDSLLLVYGEIFMDINLEIIWHALGNYRENCIPEGQDPTYDEEWGDICTQMAWIAEELNQEEDV